VLHIDLPDGSSAHFRFAVVIEAPDLGEVGIFTEHCGYHIFPLHESRIHVQDGV
jgi:hypothetical protein